MTVLPKNIPLSRVNGNLSPQGIYLYNSGDYLIILVMEAAEQESVVDLFGTENWEQIES